MGANFNGAELIDDPRNRLIFRRFVPDLDHVLFLWKHLAFPFPGVGPRVGPRVVPPRHARERAFSNGSQSTIPMEGPMGDGRLSGKDQVDKHASSICLKLWNIAHSWVNLRVNRDETFSG